MENEILKIILRNTIPSFEQEHFLLMNYADADVKAKEISAMMERFIRWVSAETIYSVDNYNWCTFRKPGKKYKTLTDLFNFWLTNIENKSNT